MTFSDDLNLGKFDALHEWIPVAAKETGVDEQTLWNIAEKLFLEPGSTESLEAELRLKVLYEIHYNRLEGVEQDALGSWVTVNFSVNGRKEQFQFSYGQFSVPLQGDECDVEAMKRITREEGMEVTVNDPEVIATRPDDRGPVWALQVTKRILKEVYGASLADVNWAKEEGGYELAWSEIPDYR